MPSSRKQQHLVRFKPITLLIMQLSVVDVAFSDTIDLISGWNGTSSINAWGTPNTQTYGQTITPTSAINLNSFAFELDKSSGADQSFNAYIYEYDTSTNQIIGNALFNSGNLNLPNATGFQNISISTNGTHLNAGHSYVLMFTTQGLTQSDGSYIWGAHQTTNPYTGGLFVYNNGDYTSTSWSTISSLDLAFLMVFSTGPSAEDTQAALQANVAALQGIYSIQTGTINNSLTYDCSYFDSKGLCLSTGGRYSNASNSHANTTSAMVIGGYRIDQHFRIGAYIDQNLYNTEAGSIASLRSNTPLLGVFGVWNENADQTGFEARLAAAYNNSNMDINRIQVGTSELGYGKTGIDTLSGSATLSYGIKVVPNWMASPYLGVRHTTVSSSGYSEQATDDVTAPLTYNGVNQESLTALLGIKATGRLTDQLGLQASAGLEQDMHTYTSAYAATGVDGLTAINFSPNMQKSRAVTTFGATYDVAKGHRLGLNAVWRQESFQNIDTKMAYVNYTMAF